MVNGSVLDCWPTSQTILHQGQDSLQIHLIRPACPWFSIALTVQNNLIHFIVCTLICSLAPHSLYTMSAIASTEEEVKSVWRKTDCVCFDVDSTVCTDEGVDELAAFLNVGKEVADL